MNRQIIGEIFSKKDLSLNIVMSIGKDFSLLEALGGKTILDESRAEVVEYCKGLEKISKRRKYRGWEDNFWQREGMQADMGRMMYKKQPRIAHKMFYPMNPFGGSRCLVVDEKLFSFRTMFFLFWYVRLRDGNTMAMIPLDLRSYETMILYSDLLNKLKINIFPIIPESLKEQILKCNPDVSEESLDMLSKKLWKYFLKQSSESFLAGCTTVFLPFEATLKDDLMLSPLAWKKQEYIIDFFHELIVKSDTKAKRAIFTAVHTEYENCVEKRKTFELTHFYFHKELWVESFQKDYGVGCEKKLYRELLRQIKSKDFE